METKMPTTGVDFMNKERRKTTRTELWFDAVAYAESDYGVIKGSVHNFGAKGMFLKTTERFPENSDVEITVLFRTKIPSELSGIKGKVVRTSYKGMGISFTEIDLVAFRKCMISIMED